MAQADEFLKNFDPTLRSHIIEFGKKLAQTEADVYILMARKAACFLECLETLNLTRLNGKVTTDRVLDMDSKWLKNKTVVVIDDTIISGTTIYETLKFLDDAQVKEASVMVFCIDDYWYKEELIQFRGAQCLQPPFLKLEHAECLKFCSDIVKSLSIFPRPYSIDFPIYPETRIPFSQFEEYFTKTEWLMHENTSVFQQGHDIRVFALSPDDRTTKEFEEKIGFKISRLAHLKIRFYCKKFETHKQESVNKSHRKFRDRVQVYYMIKVLPFVLFEPMEDVTINRIYQFINDLQGATTDNGFTSLSSKLRLLQYFFSFHLVQFWKTKFESVTGASIRLNVSKRSLDYIFVNPTKFVTPLLNHSKIDMTSLKFETKPSPLPKNEQSENETPFNPLLINSTLVEQFTKLYHESELPARRWVKKEGVKAFTNPLYKDKLNRLKKGMSFNDLVKTLEVFTRNSLFRKQAVSHFLDTAVDFGIVVPITCQVDNTVYRAYRHGEDVIWGENNDRLIGYLFENFKNNSGKKKFRKIWFEKLFVVFLKIGIHRNILFQYDYDTSRSEKISIISIRSYLFGQVTVTDVIEKGKTRDLLPIIDDEHRGMWTFDRLKEEGFIKETGEDFEIESTQLIDLYKIKNPDRFPDEPSDFGDDARFVAEEVGDTFGILRANKLISVNDMVVLTSCLNPHDALNSIAAEMSIFDARWIKNRDNILLGPLSSKKRDYISMSESLRLPTKNISWVAINSGEFKFSNFQERTGFKLINDIDKVIKEKFGKNQSAYMSRAWLGFWSKNQAWHNERSPKITSLIDEIGTWLIETCFYYYAVSAIILKLARTTGQENKRIEQLEIDSNDQLSRVNETRMEIEKIQRETMRPEKKGQIDFDLQAKLAPLEKRKKKMEGNLRDIKKRIKNWKTLLEQTVARTNDYANSYSTFFQQDTLISAQEELKVIVDNEHSESELLKYLGTYIEGLNRLKYQSGEVLNDYKLSVPMWGRISAYLTYRYCLYIKIDPEDLSKSIENKVSDVLSEYEKEELNYQIEKQGTFIRFAPTAQTGRRLLITVGAFNAEKRLVDFFSKVKGLFEGLNVKANYYLINKLSSLFEIKWREKNTQNEPDYIDFGAFLKILDHIDTRTEDNGIYLLKDRDSDFIFPDRYAGKDETNVLLPDEKDAVYQKEQNVKKYLCMQDKFKTADIGAIGIVEPELTAFAKFLEGAEKNLKHPTNRYYTEGHLTTKAKKYAIALTRQLSQGTDSVQSAYAALKEQYKPKFMVLFGIAGSVHKDVKIGDVVIATAVIGYDKAKDRGSEGITRRGDLFKPEPEMLRELGNFEDQIGETPSVVSPFNNAKFRIHVGPIGSGSAVIGSDLSTIKKWLKDFNDKTLAVETEAIGFVNFNYEEKLNRKEMKHIIIVRGISDSADEDKNTDETFRRNQASANAAKTVELLLKTFPDVTKL